MSVIEMSRPSVEQVSSLNSTRSRNSNDSKSSASELLSITDAAVSALSKTSNPKVKSYVRNNERQTGFSLLSPTDAFQNQTSPCGHDVCGQLSDGSRSTTESEVLIMSTLKDHDVLAHHNRSSVSEISKGSNTSGASSAFITGQAQRVKVSSKKLKEIKSPFENKDGDKKISTASVERAEHRVKSSKILSADASASMNKSKDDKMQNSQSSFIGEMKTFPCQRLNASDDHINNKETITSTDSGYMTQNIKVIREKWPAQEEIDKEETPRDVPSMTEEINDDLHRDSPIDVIAQDKERQSSDTSVSSGNPDIFTVRETLVTIQATDVDGTASQSSVGSSASQQPGDMGSTARSLEQRFSKFHTSHLRQGTLGADNQSEAMLNSGQVYIAKTSLTEKEKQLKEAFCKRDLPTHAVKKHVIPTVIQRELNPAVDPKAPGPTSVNEAATTAAVAAASAVAATQPFLKAQQDMEMRIAQLIQQISSVQQQPRSTSGPDSNKIEELERQLNDLTQHRIQYLEDMQKQQLQWQAQFLGMSRTASGRHVAPPSEYHQQYDGWVGTGGKKAFTKHVMSDEELGFSQYKPNRSTCITQEKAKSVLDTPAPRSKPPTPTILDDSQRSGVRGHIKEHVTPDRKNKVSGGLLAQILSQDGDTPQKSPFPETPPSVRLPAKRYDVVNQQTEDLVKELGDLRSQMKQVIADARPWTKDAAENTSRVSPTVLDQTISMYDGPAPLDQYLNKIVPPTINPYPSLKPSEGNAPVISNFSDVQEVLKKVSLSRTILESNMESILRNRKLTDTAVLLQTLGHDSSLSERMRIQKLVDKHIKAMNTNMEREVLDELLKVEEAKKSRANFMIPERDTTTTVSKVKESKVKVTGTRSRLRTEARVDTWMNRRRDMMKSAATKAAGEKENIPEKRQKKVKEEDKKMYSYNKTQIVPQRRTQKEPYLRFRSTSPKSLSPKIIGRPAQTKGLIMSSVKSQVGDGSLPEASPWIQQQQQQQQQAPPPLIPMAVPLGAPRKDGGLKAPVFFPSSPTGPVTSTPYDDTRPANVGITAIKDKSLEEEQLRQLMNEKTKKAANLQKMTLPSVDVDSFQTSPVTRSSGASSPRSKVISHKAPEPKENVQYHKVIADETAKSVESESESEDTLTEDVDSDAIDLPGFKAPPKPAYHGPVFPPQAPLIATPTSSVPANDIRRQDLLQQQALDWVEQELMAKIISEVYIKKQDAVPHTTQTAAESDRHRVDDSDIESEISQLSSHESFIAEGLGQDGLQLFVDAGQPVDDKLVTALLKEVMLEKIACLVGERTSKDQRTKPQDTVSHKYKQVPAAKRRQQIDSPIQIRDTPIPTPKPTPRHTPPPQLRDEPFTVVTPDRTPSPSLVNQPQPVVTKVTTQPQPVVTQVRSEAQPVVTNQPEPVITKVTEQVVVGQAVEESDESVTDESVETRFNRIIEGHPLPQLHLGGESTVPPRYEVSTPNATPPQSPPPPPQIVPSPGIVSTPSPSLYTPTPQHVQPDTANTPQVAAPVLPVGHDESTQADSKAQKPKTCSIAVQANEEAPPQAPSPPVSAPASPPASPKVQQRRVSSSSGESVESSSPVSDTINERVSEGQWLLPLYSEGEVPELDINQDLYGRIRQHLLAGGKPPRVADTDVSQAEDTLLDTDDLDPEEETGEFPQSEGEFHPSVLNRRPLAMTNIMAQLEQLTNRSVQRLDHPAAHTPAVNISVGEVVIGQRPVTSSHLEQSSACQQRSGGSLHGDNGRPHTAAERQALDEISEEGEQRSESPKVKTISVQPQSSTRGGSPFRGQIRPVTVTPGGREPSRHYKRGYGPGGRQRGIQTSRSFSPEPSGGATQTSDKFSETATSRTSLYASSELDTQTSDQMNVEALLESQDYLANTQTDLGSTAGDSDLGQSGKLTYSLTRSEELRYQSGVMQRSPGSTSDMSLAPGLTKTLERSEEELAQDSRQSHDDNSDLQLTAEREKSGHPGHSGPLQVSVTIPSVGEEDSQTQESYDDVSEISLV